MTRRRIFGVLSILWMIVIFAFSSRSGADSTGDSTRLTRFLAYIFGQGYYTYNDTVDFLVRKAAHMSEYFILAIFVTQYLVKDYKAFNKSYFISWLIVSIYSITDEIHQLFVPDRAGQIRDVCIDSIGAALGVMVSMAVIRLIINRSRRKAYEKG